MIIKEISFKIIVKTNAAKNEILNYDKEKEAYRISIKAKPEGGKANIEIVKFLSKLLKKRVRIVKGLRGREKLVRCDM